MGKMYYCIILNIKYLLIMLIFVVLVPVMYGHFNPGCLFQGDVPKQ